MPNFSYCFEAVGGAVAMAYSGYGRAAYTPGERRLPAAQWMEDAQTCPIFIFLYQPVTSPFEWVPEQLSRFLTDPTIATLLEHPRQ